MNKIMDAEERAKCISALTNWFDSQSIEPTNSMVIMMETLAIVIGATAPNANELEKALEAVKKDVRSIAFRSYATHSNA